MELTPTSPIDVVAELFRTYDDQYWRTGSAEPWVVDILAALLRGNATRTAIEIGGFEGYTSRALLKAMQTLPWQKSLTVCELDPERAALVQAALSANGHCNYASVVCANSLDWIPTLPNASVDFVWLDGNHEQSHVWCELQELAPKLAPGGLICGHDVFGTCALWRLFEEMAVATGWLGMSLNLPALSHAGGLGLIQRPR